MSSFDDDSMQQSGSAQSPGLGAQTSKSKGLGKLAQSARTDQLRSARTTMYVIGLLTIAVNLFFALGAPSLVNAQFDTEMKAAQQKQPGLEFDMEKIQALKNEAITATQISGFGFAGLGVVFIILGVLIYKFPVPCTVLALVLFLAGQGMTAMADPQQLARGWIIKVIIIAALVKAIQAALAYRREQLASGV